MDKLDLIIWILGAGFATTFGIMLTMWNSLNQRMDRMDARFDRIDERMDKLDENMIQVDRRLCRLEGAFSSKDCCQLKPQSNHKYKANR